MVYMITYDLNQKGQQYENVIAAIKEASSGVWCSFWKSSYLIKSNLPTADEVFNRIKPYLDANDTLFVTEITDNYQGWLSDAQWTFVENSLF